MAHRGGGPGSRVLRRSPLKTLVLNPGSQKDFVNNPHRSSAYIGGLGSGKTFAGIARGLKFASQPKPAGATRGARGLCGAISYPVLNDVVVPQFFDMVEGTGLLKQYIRQDRKAILTNGAEILFRSLDEPNRIRGIELSWFFIDEGRHLNKNTWDILVGRLRQPGFHHAGWVCSTPNGYDWMWQLFHDESPHQLPDSKWYGAPTTENSEHLPPEYIRDLKAQYEGKFYEQEVLGKFVGLMSGAVFPHWDSRIHTQEVPYREDLPLYSAWDFGVGDPGVCLFAQIEHVEKKLDDGTSQWVPNLHFIGFIEAQDWGAEEWAEAWYAWLDAFTEGRRPNLNVGDPAGKQRNANGTSWIDALAAQGVSIRAAPKRAPEFGVLILDNMMAGGRVIVDKDRCARLGAALSTHRWNTDDQGIRIGTKPVHDWTSHFADAARYLAASLLSHFPRRSAKPENEPPGPGTMGHIVRQLTAPVENWLGAPPKPAIEWHPSTIEAR